MYTWPRIFLWYKLIFFLSYFTVQLIRTLVFIISPFFFAILQKCLCVSSPKNCQVFLSYSILKAEVKFLVNLNAQLMISWRLFSSESKKKKRFLTTKKSILRQCMSKLLKSYLKKKVENVFSLLHTLCYPCPFSRWQVHWV